MLKTTNIETGEVRYYLTEAERVSLASEEAKQFVAERIKNIGKYNGKGIDFFTDKKVKESNKWYFNVNVDGVLYFGCVYDNEDRTGYTGLAAEAFATLLWRYGDGGCSYAETIGNYIEDGKEYTPADTGYNEIEEYYFQRRNRPERYAKETCEELELTEELKPEVLKQLLG